MNNFNYNANADNETRRLFIGIDVGSVSVKAVATDEYGKVYFEKYVRSEGDSYGAVLRVLTEFCERLPNARVAGAAATGSGKELVSKALGAAGLNEIAAHAIAAWTIEPRVNSVIEIGGQDSKYIVIGRGADGRPYAAKHAFNELCAAGVGAFLDQQAARLGMTIEDFSRAAASSVNPSRIAGRCAVFAKSDMIHLQQQAASQADIAAGLCFALARGYLATLCRGVPPKPPIVFQGGVARNDGAARAFREILSLAPDELIRPARCDTAGALGAAAYAVKTPFNEEKSPSELLDSARAFKVEPEKSSSLPRLKRRKEELPGEKKPAAKAGAKLFLGVDVGSSTVKAAAADEEGGLAASVYAPSLGRPLDALKVAMLNLRAKLPQGTRFEAVATTGSGRHLAKEALQALCAIDEITAQAASARRYAPAARMVFEIGGQDSKFISFDDGETTNFIMNRACAAGTGSFLEEQAGRLGVAINDSFSEAAFAAESAVELGSRCAVFMDSDLVSRVQRGAGKNELCAGLAYAAARNYLEKVVGSAKIEGEIVFQGGVAKNEAARAALEALTGKEIATHPFPEISGALGAALIAASRSKSEVARKPVSFDDLDYEAETSSFVCRLCENLCEIGSARFADGRKAFFGSVCGRFERGIGEPIKADDLFELRERLLNAQYPSARASADRGEVFFPYALSMREHLPFWSAFFRSAGFKIELTRPTDRAVAELGVSTVPAEFCHPVKILFGHVRSLALKGAKNIFIPHPRLLEVPGERELRYACPYTQAAPYVAAGTGASVLTLEYPVKGEEESWAQTAAQKLGAPIEEIKAAMLAGLNAQRAFFAACETEGRKALAALKKSGKTGAVLLGRPYNAADRHVNCQLARRLSALGIEPVPFEFLPLAEEKLPDFWGRVRWSYGRRLLKAARLVKRSENLAAVIVTNYGCGPDAFITQYLERELAGAPRITVEFDDHQAAAGLVTRLEAFAQTLKSKKFDRRETVFGTPPGRAKRPLRELVYYVPDFADHSRAFTGALRGAGCEAVLLPKTDDEAWRLGMSRSYGRECHPFVAFAGDILKAAKRPGFDPERACFFAPSYFGPCLLPQYMVALRLILDREGLNSVTLLNIADPPTMKSLGYRYIMRLALGIYAIDGLFKRKTESEPYEVNKGEIARVHAENMLLMEEGIAKGRLFAALKEASRRLSRIELSKEAGSRPAIGVVGDVYTRVNERANDDLYKRLEELGFEVWPSCSLIDVSFAGLEQLHMELKMKGRTYSSIAAKGLVPLIAKMRGLIDDRFESPTRAPKERQFPQVYACSQKYANHFIDKALSLNLSRIEELSQAGAAGAINAMCHNCMLGAVTDALLAPMSAEMPQLATMSLVYEGRGSAHIQNRIEAFALRIKKQ